MDDLDADDLDGLYADMQWQKNDTLLNFVGQGGPINLQ